MRSRGHRSDPTVKGVWSQDKDLVLKVFAYMLSRPFERLDGSGVWGHSSLVLQPERSVRPAEGLAVENM